VLNLQQSAVDRRDLNLARELLELDGVGFSLDDSSMIRISDKANGSTKTRVLPLLSLVSFQRYRISELLIEFAVVAEDRGSDIAGGQNRLRVVPLDSPTEHVRLACFKVVGKEPVFAEFQIAGEIKATVNLGI
jgi:hypothetical protein